jgi:hypothetical protein
VSPAEPRRHALKEIDEFGLESPGLARAKGIGLELRAGVHTGEVVAMTSQVWR